MLEIVWIEFPQLFFVQMIHSLVCTRIMKLSCVMFKNQEEEGFVTFGLHTINFMICYIYIFEYYNIKILMILKSINNCAKLFPCGSLFYNVKLFCSKQNKDQKGRKNVQIKQQSIAHLKSVKMPKIHNENQNNNSKEHIEDIIRQEPKIKQDSNFKMFQMMIQEMKTDRKRAQQQKQKSAKVKDVEIKYLRYGLVATAAGLFLTVIGLVAYNMDLQPAIKQWWRRKQILEEYGSGELDIPGQYLENNSIQKKFKQILGSNLQLLHFVTGISGSGKSTAICFLANKLRKQGKKIYYINLRVEDEETNIMVQKVLQKIKDMEELLKAVYYKPQTRNGATIIIDNIHLLQLHKDEMQITGLLALITSAPKSKTRIIAVSSSSSFYERAHSLNFFDKASRDYVIQILNEQERKALINRYREGFKKQGTVIPDQVIQQISSDTSLRNIIRNLHQIRQNMVDQPQISPDDLIKLIKQIQQQTIQKNMIKMQLAFSKAKLLPQRRDEKTQKQVAVAIVQAILSLPTEMKTSDYSLVKKYMETKMRFVGFYTTLKCVIDQFDKHNLLMFCHPRSRPVRIAFERILNKIS